MVGFWRSQTRQIAPWLYTARTELKVAVNKTDVRNFYQFMNSHQSSFDSYQITADDIQAEVWVDGVKYSLTSQKNFIRLDLEAFDGNQIVSIRDFSTDGTIDWFSREVYDYWSLSYKPAPEHYSRDEYNIWIDGANKDYQKYLYQLMRHFKIPISGEVNV